MGACRHCGQELRGDEPWCPRCHARRLTPAEEEAQIGALFGAIHEGEVESRRMAWEPEPRHLEPKRETRYSRFRRGPTSFGPIGRFFSTLVFMFPLATLPFIRKIAFGEVTNAHRLVIAVAWMAVNIPALRHIWRKAPLA